MVVDALVNLGCLGRSCIIGLGMNHNLDASLSCKLQPTVCVQRPLSQVFLIEQLSRTLQEERSYTTVSTLAGMSHAIAGFLQYGLSIGYKFRWTDTAENCSQPTQRC
jgi:hypothetical protein